MHIVLYQQKISSINQFIYKYIRYKIMFSIGKYRNHKYERSIENKFKYLSCNQIEDEEAIILNEILKINSSLTMIALDKKLIKN